MPLISVIIPAYNPGNFLIDAIESIHSQTFTDWEVLVVDDDSREDVKTLCAPYSRVRYIRQSHGGVSVARNRGILNSSSEFIAFMDQDDVWLPDKLERQYQAMVANPGAAICYCDLEVFSGSVETCKAKMHPSTVNNVEIVLHPNSHFKINQRSSLHHSIAHFSQQFIVPSTVLVRRSALASSGLLDPFIPFSGDYDLLIKIGSLYPVIHAPFTGTLYRKHEKNFSDQYEVGRQEVEALITRYRQYALSQGDKTLARDVATFFRRPGKMYASQAVDCARRTLKQKQFTETCSHLIKAFTYHPLFVVHSLLKWAFPKRH